MGGIGSASVILALRSTMENVIGGLLLKLEDKIRVGEVITVPGDGKKTGTVWGNIYLIKTTAKSLETTHLFHNYSISV